jgi:hypothetical protein
MSDKKYFTWMGKLYEDYYYNLAEQKKAAAKEKERQKADAEICLFCEYPTDVCSCCISPPYCDGPAYCNKCNVLNDETYLEKTYREPQETPKPISKISKRKLRF